MDSLLTIKHRDFTLRVDCSKFDLVRAKAEGNISRENLLCTYRMDEGVEWVEYRGERMEGNVWDALFFDNTDYPVWVDFEGDDVDLADVMANRQSVYENFAYHEEKRVLSGFLNYGNEIGKTSLELRYVKGGMRKRWAMHYEVLSSKLDYRSHWPAILRDIESEYRMLSLDFLKKTYHGFGTSKENEQKDLIWWNIFKEKQAELVRNVKLIIDRPKQRLRDCKDYRRADQLKRMTPSLEKEFAEHRNRPDYLYSVDVPQLNRDTMENRFLKYVVGSVAARHEELARKVLDYKDVSLPLQQEIASTDKELKVLQRHPFFRGIGKFKGLTQESLTLQKATGYNQVYKIWLILNRAYDLDDSLYKLETKDIATLYEIWCFIEVKNIVKGILEKDAAGVEVENRSRVEMNKLFTYELSRGENSRILFKQGEVELAELIYNPQQDKQSNKHTGISQVVSRTVPQRPDIVLQLTKRDTVTGLKLTYLFDAKYRLGEKTQAGSDMPPEDAINQMHRYRDALYYNEHPGYVGKLEPTDLKREVIGGYILFPGDGPNSDVRRTDFFKAISEVNIGAFPLKPNEHVNRELLEDFVAGLIRSNSDELIGAEKSIPQKGLKYEMAEEDPLVMVALVGDGQKRDWSFEKKWYNIPLEKVADSPMMQAKYLLLHTTKEHVAGNLCKMVKSKYDVWTKGRLIEEGYPSEPSKDSYFMLRLHAPKETEEQLRELRFDLDKVEPYWGVNHHGGPFYFVKLSALMRAGEPAPLPR